MEPEKSTILLSEITGSRFQSITADNQRQARLAREARNILNANPEMNPACWGNKMDPGWYIWGSSKVLEGYRQIRKAVKLLTWEYY